MEQGWKNRSVGSTSMNDESSRSHSIFTVSIEMMSTGKKTKLHLINVSIPVIFINNI
jgi:kinesin family protein 3/17